MPPKQQTGGQPVDQVNQFMSMPIPLPYAILLMLLGTGGSGAVGALTWDGDIEAVKAAITAQQSEERAHYSEVMATLRAVNERLDRLEARINQKENDR